MTMNLNEVQIFLGIDPGFSGGFALYKQGRKPLIFSADDSLEFIDTLKHFNEKYAISFAVLEQVHAFQQGGASSNFSFGGSYWLWRGLLTTLQIPHVLISPMKWQSTILDSVKSKKLKIPINATAKEVKSILSKQKRLQKQVAVNFINRRFPELKLKKGEHNEADAICIAMYACKYYSNQLRKS